jgi:hypothetical protein
MSTGGLTETQNAMVLHHLQTIGPLTPLEALNRYGIMRLGARRYDLIHKMGYDVQTRIVKSGRFAEYFLPLPKGQLEFPVFQTKPPVVEVHPGVL